MMILSEPIYQNQEYSLTSINSIELQQNDLTTANFPLVNCIQKMKLSFNCLITWKREPDQSSLDHLIQEVRQNCTMHCLSASGNADEDVSHLLHEIHILKNSTSIFRVMLTAIPNSSLQHKKKKKALCFKLFNYTLLKDIVVVSKLIIKQCKDQSEAHLLKRPLHQLKQDYYHTPQWFIDFLKQASESNFEEANPLLLNKNHIIKIEPLIFEQNELTSKDFPLIKHTEVVNISFKVTLNLVNGEYLSKLENLQKEVEENLDLVSSTLPRKHYFKANITHISLDFSEKNQLFIKLKCFFPKNSTFKKKKKTFDLTFYDQIIIKDIFVIGPILFNSFIQSHHSFFDTYEKLKAEHYPIPKWLSKKIENEMEFAKTTSFNNLFLASTSQYNLLFRGLDSFTQNGMTSKIFPLIQTTTEVSLTFTIQVDWKEDQTVEKLKNLTESIKQNMVLKMHSAGGKLNEEFAPKYCLIHFGESNDLQIKIGYLATNKLQYKKTRKCLSIHLFDFPILSNILVVTPKLKKKFEAKEDSFLYKKYLKNFGKNYHVPPWFLNFLKETAANLEKKEYDRYLLEYMDGGEELFTPINLENIPWHEDQNENLNKVDLMEEVDPFAEFDPENFLTNQMDLEYSSCLS